MIYKGKNIQIQHLILTSQQPIPKSQTSPMINFASLFNQFRTNTSSISDLLEDTTAIDRLLDQQSFVNQYKSGNSKVQQYMKYEKYLTLVKYVTEVGPSEDRKRSFKYPLSACEILSVDNTQALDFFFGDNAITVQQEVPNEAAVKNEKVNTEAASQDSNVQKQENVEEIKQSEEQKIQEQNTKEHLTQSENVATSQKSEDVSEEAVPKTKIIEKEVDHLRHPLFSYFKGDVNYTLAGYVSRVFSTFFTKKPQEVIAFLLELENFNFILQHIESRSVGELVVKLISHESIENKQIKQQAFEKMIEKVSKPSEVYILSNLALAICQIIEKIALSVKNKNQQGIQLSKIYITPQIITKIIENVMSDEENVSVYNAPILQAYLTNFPQAIPENAETIAQFKNLLQSFLKKSLVKLNLNRKIRPTLGFGRVKIVQVLSFVLKQNILGARDLAAQEQQLFPTLFNLCSVYQYNNVLHNEVLKIVTIALSQSKQSPFLSSLIENDKLLKFLTAQAEQDQKIRAGSGSQKSRKGYIGHIVSICRKIQQISQTNQTVAKLNEKKQFQKIIESLISKEIFEYNKNLAGFSMKKGNKNTILFGKEQIIQEHLKFLAASPPPVFQVEPEHINIEHPDLIEAEKIQAEAELKEEVEEKELQQKVLSEEEHFNPRYFKNHLEYELDDLMVGL